MIALPPAWVVSLRSDVARRQHIVRHFHEIGIEHFGFWPAVHGDAIEVADAYRQGIVAAWPPCFRCGLEACSCDNNVILPQQAANWLSFMGLWRSLPDDPDHFILVCEDDVAFHAGAVQNLVEFLAGFRRSRRHVLMRLARSGMPPFQILPRALPQRTERIVMSNAAYILNGSMAHRLLRAFDGIRHTSDVWVHRSMAASQDVEAFTLEPLLATDLSYNQDHAMFASRIHPKGIDPEDLLRKASHRMRVASAEDYQNLRAAWERHRG
jgi:GR25 family glycosyltransferase involved in LPS biosynthesis